MLTIAVARGASHLAGRRAVGPRAGAGRWTAHDAIGGAVVWVCRDCGLEVEARDSVLVSTIGWTALDGDTGVCAPCSRRAAATTTSAVRRTLHCLEASERAVATSRARVEQARAARWDDAYVHQAAIRLGFVSRPCDACDGRRDESCRQCDGEGEVWRRGETMVSRATLLKLGMLPSRG